jgi:hypothetical protein
MITQIYTKPNIGDPVMDRAIQSIIENSNRTKKLEKEVKFLRKEIERLKNKLNN